MIQGFRKIFQSPIGLALTLGFVALIALAFASADITGGSFGGIGGSERVATVGDQRISTSDLRTTINGSYENARADNPSLTMADFLEAGAAEGLLDQQIERNALYQFGLDHGIRIGESLIGSELSQMAAFQGPDGKFSQELYNTALTRRGLSDKLVREDISQGLVARMLLVPTTSGDIAPNKIAKRYTALLNETRHGGITLIPSPSFVDDKEVSDDTLKKYLAENRARYTLPERRTVRYARFGVDALGDEITATDAEIEARFQQNAAQYAAREERTIEQLILPTEAAANAVLEKANAGSSLAAAARDTGLETNTATANSRAALASSTSSAVAQAVYEGSEGNIVGPVRGPLGWYLVRIADVSAIPATTLASVRDTLAGQIVAEKTRTALADKASAIEENLQAGQSIADTAKSLGVAVQTSAALLEDGSAYDGSEVGPEVARLAGAVFAMSPNGDAQITAGSDGETYVVYAPGTVTASAPPPFAELKERLTRDYKIAEGAKQAKTAANKVMKAVEGGKSLTEALADLDIRTPPVDNIDLTRRQLMASRQQQGVPPPLALMFTMAPKTAKMLEAPQGLGYFVISLDSIDVPEVTDEDPTIAQTAQELARLRGQELQDQLRLAITESVPVSRNETAIEVVRQQLNPSQN
ncbi:peptidylprolyl isomerase [Croceicoccus mobilis]|uniref:Parvulin-like PPIase n=1 Tax=Croceicoccus mobilis TaxID=1703339 RepID=A0A917DW49_9SPHN|nr:peptidylprolyl isomerase [Croceicoccus mobilis]GGD76256.1 peptidylprolyl isomerase [Croceicoccus mobilis]